jgi:hypothetical protein
MLGFPLTRNFIMLHLKVRWIGVAYLATAKGLK